MSDTTKAQLDLELRRLEKRIEELTVSMEHLKEENRALRQRHEALANELLRLREREGKLEGDYVGRVRSLRERVEATLEKSQQLEL